MLKVVFVDDRVLFCHLLLVRTGSALEESFLSLALLNGIQEVVALLTELISHDVLILELDLFGPFSCVKNGCFANKFSGVVSCRLS